MTRKKTPNKPRSYGAKNLHCEFLNASQKMAWLSFQKHDVLFLLGPAGTGKSFLSTAFAIHQVLNRDKKKIVLTRPIVESGGEKIGFLPGDVAEKVGPYMQPLFDCTEMLVGQNPEYKKKVQEATDIVPIALMRGRSFHDAVCILDEAQNATFAQLKLFLTRFGENSKIIITGDPKQSDLDSDKVPLVDVMSRLQVIPGIGTVQFSTKDIVRHPLVAEIIEKLEA